MAHRLLAGDVGGTKTNLALYTAPPGAVRRESGAGTPVASSRTSPGSAGAGCCRLLREATFRSATYPGLIEILTEFLAGDPDRVHAAVLGIAGPVIEGDVFPPNLPWSVDDKAVAALLRTPRVRLMNDLETTAYGLLFLPPADFLSLSPGIPRRGNRAVIAAGTGLGQAILQWDGARYRPSATEGGHADFAPRTDREIALLNHLMRRFSRVSYERVLSGPGLFNIFEFLVNEVGMRVEPEIVERMKTEDPAAVVGTAGVAGSCEACVEALRLFVSVYGAQAGNLALAAMATGGLYVAGGIVTKILPRMTDGVFMNAFTEKGRSTALLKQIPVLVVLNPKASLVGAAEAAREMVD